MAQAFNLVFLFLCLQLVNCQFGLINGIRNTVSDAFGAVGNIIRPNQNYPHGVVKPIIFPNHPPLVSMDFYQGPVSTLRTPIQDRPVSTLRTPNQDLAVSAVYGGKPCTTTNGGEGECIILSSCQPFMTLIKDETSRPIVTWLLRQSRCDSDKVTADSTYCCPKDVKQDDKANQVEPVTQGITEEITTLPPTTLPSTTLPSTTLPSTTSTLPQVVNSTGKSKPATNFDLIQFGETCKTVYNTTGSCKDVYLCEPFVALAKTVSKNPAAAVVLRKSACGFRKNIPQVCCPLPGQSASLRIADTNNTLPANKTDFLTALPVPPVCGLTNITLDRVVGGIPAKLGAFPWMALLGYKDFSVRSNHAWKCGGALLSTRHVLTAAHCIHHQEDYLYVVRLGELDLDREDEGATPIDVPIKAMNKHEFYTKNNPLMYDIGVLVLAKDVEFTNLIKPICLFTGSTNTLKSESFENYNPFVAGWGDTQWKGIPASHLQVAQLPVLSSQVCEQKYLSYVRANKRTQFSEQAMCAGFTRGKIDSCSGDSGGPLMLPIDVDGFYTSSYMYAIGVVSAGRHCAQPGVPGVYTRVSHYMPWIEKQLLGNAS